MVKYSCGSGFVQCAFIWQINFQKSAFHVTVHVPCDYVMVGAVLRPCTHTVRKKHQSLSGLALAYLTDDVTLVAHSGYRLFE